MIYLELFYTFLMIGAFTFGGGYAMLPLIQSEVAARWGSTITAESMVNFVAVSESTPGPFAINMATYVGAEMGGPFGSFCATMGVVLPSFVIILIVAKCYDKFKESRIVKGCMSGLKPAVVGLIANAVLGVLMTVFFPAKEMPARSAIYTKPAASVLKPYSLPSRLTMVLTLPMAAAVSSITSHKGITSRL